jgi:hypothetical protein
MQFSMISHLMVSRHDDNGVIIDAWWMSDEWSDESVIVVTQHQLFGEVAKFQNVSMSQGGSKFKVIWPFYLSPRPFWINRPSFEEPGLRSKIDSLA